MVFYRQTKWTETFGKYVKKYTRYVPNKMLTATNRVPINHLYRWLLKPGVRIILLRSEIVFQKNISLNTHISALGLVNGTLPCVYCRHDY